MKRLMFSLATLSTLFVWAGSGEENSYRKVDNGAFKRGESLKFRIHYGTINAGEAVVVIDQSNKPIHGRSTLHAVGKGYSLGAFDWFFKVRDHYETYMDEAALIPWIFVRNVDEGGFKINQNQIYDHKNGKVLSNGKSVVVPKNIQDMLSSFYFARTINFSKAKVGDVFSIPTFVDDEIWELKMRYIGTETIKSQVGRVNCLKFRPIVQKGRVFKKEEDMTVWISNDQAKVPVRAEADILVGSIKMDLVGYSGLTAPLNIQKK